MLLHGEIDHEQTHEAAANTEAGLLWSESDPEARQPMPSVQSEPAIRWQKVLAIRRALASNGYQVSSLRLAESLLKHGTRPGSVYPRYPA